MYVCVKYPFYCSQVRVFFGMLDDELNKVNQFYIKQENEFIERGEALNKQLQILQDLKQIINDRRRKKYPPTKANNTETFPRSPARDSDYSLGQFSTTNFKSFVDNSKFNLTYFLSFSIFL